MGVLLGGFANVVVASLESLPPLKHAILLDRSATLLERSAILFERSTDKKKLLWEPEGSFNYKWGKQKRPRKS